MPGHLTIRARLDAQPSCALLVPKGVDGDLHEDVQHPKICLLQRRDPFLAHEGPVRSLKPHHPYPENCFPHSAVSKKKIVSFSLYVANLVQRLEVLTRMPTLDYRPFRQRLSYCVQRTHSGEGRLLCLLQLNPFGYWLD